MLDLSLASPGAEAFNVEEEERKTRKAEEEQFSDEEDYCRAGSYPEETRRPSTRGSYHGDAAAEPSRSDNVSATRKDNLM